MATTSDTQHGQAAKGNLKEPRAFEPGEDKHGDEVNRLLSNWREFEDKMAKRNTADEKKLKTLTEITEQAQETIATNVLIRGKISAHGELLKILDKIYSLR